jgi:hypothetical protein
MRTYWKPLYHKPLYHVIITNYSTDPTAWVNADLLETNPKSSFKEDKVNPTAWVNADLLETFYIEM